MCEITSRLIEQVSVSTSIVQWLAHLPFSTMCKTCSIVENILGRIFSTVENIQFCKGVPSAVLRKDAISNWEGIHFCKGMPSAVLSKDAISTVEDIQNDGGKPLAVWGGGIIPKILLLPSTILNILNNAEWHLSTELTS